MMSLFLPEYFLVAMPMGLIQSIWKGGLENGLIMKPSLSSLRSNVSTVSGSVNADCRLLQVNHESGTVKKPG